MKEFREPLVAAADGAPRAQSGALCWRRSPSGVEVLLVTSRETGRWIIPKGWPHGDETAPATALREAWEEAGVRGRAGSEAGLFTYDKVIDRAVVPPRALPCIVTVYPVEVVARVRRYPESGQRRVKWFTRDKAARKVLEPGLRDLILAFDPGRAGAAEP